MNRKSIVERARIIHCLVEGNSIRSTARLMDCSKNTVLRLLQDVGEACAEYQNKHLVNLPCKRVQVDEIWSFVGKKAYNEEGIRDHISDVWTYTAICPDTKIVPCWLVGERSLEDTTLFISNLASRMSARIQLTTDGYSAYMEAIEEAFGANIDYAILKKMVDKNDNVKSEKKIITGSPDDNHISTSHVERQNLLMRTGIKRFCRRTNAFSKKIENHEFAIALHFMHYNFVRPHTSLRVTPAIEAGVSDTLWSLEDVVCLIE